MAIAEVNPAGWAEIAVLEAKLRDTWARWCRAHGQLLAAVADFDTAGGPAADGVRSMLGWLMVAFGIQYSTAKALVSGAAIIGRPGVAAGLADATFSPDHVTVLAGHDPSPQAVGWAGSMSAPDLDRHLTRAEVRARPEPADPAVTAERRYVRVRDDLDGSGSKISGWLAAGDAEVVKVCLERVAHQAPPDPASGQFDPVGRRLADALVQVCSATLAADGDPDRATVSVHVDIDRDGNLCGEFADRRQLASEVLERMMCDCRAEFVAQRGTDAVVVDGPRNATGAQRRVLLRRQDGHCGWPGCTATWLLHAHHIVHWTRDGPTTLDNLIAICPYHHRLVHDQKWQLTGDPTNPTIHRPDRRPWQPPWAPLNHYTQ
jgi:hypothetical protein